MCLDVAGLTAIEWADVLGEAPSIWFSTARFFPGEDSRPKLGSMRDPHGVNEGLARQVTRRGEAADPQRVWIKPPATGMSGVRVLVSVASRYSRGRNRSISTGLWASHLTKLKAPCSGMICELKVIAFQHTTPRAGSHSTFCQIQSLSRMPQTP